MSTDRISRPQYNDIIDRFNSRVTNEAIYIEVPNKDRPRMVDLAEDKYDVRIPEITVGHGALVLTAIDDGEIAALPFAISPEQTVLPDPDDFIYGFHRHVSREVAQVAQATEGMQPHPFEAPLDMWRLDDQQVIAVLRASGKELTAKEIEIVRQLSPKTPDVVYATTRFEDDANIKILRGKVLVRHFGAGMSWFEQ